MDGLVQPVTSARRVEDMPLRRFAMRVVSELTRASDSGNGSLSPVIAKMVTDFARSGDSRALSTLYAEMRLRRVSAEDVMDAYMPDALAMIGQEWHDEEIDILHASMACARLQNLLRELGRAWVSDRAAASHAGCVLLLMPQGEQHVLGAMIAANQLRRLGVSVRIEFAPGPGVITEMLEKKRFNAVFLSVSNESSVAGTAACVDEIRKARAAEMPVIVGGGLVSQATGDRNRGRIRSETGADIATSDVHEALAFCGMRKLCAAAE